MPVVLRAGDRQVFLNLRSKRVDPRSELWNRGRIGTEIIAAARKMQRVACEF